MNKSIIVIVVLLASIQTFGATLLECRGMDLGIGNKFYAIESAGTFKGCPLSVYVKNIYSSDWLAITHLDGTKNHLDEGICSYKKTEETSSFACEKIPSRKGSL